MVGLPDVNVLAVADTNPTSPLRVHVETTADTVGCTSCGTRVRLNDRREVALAELSTFGRPTVLMWHKRRWVCPDRDCETNTFTETDARIAAVRAKVTDRAGQWMTSQVGRHGRTVAEVAGELGCDWHTVMDAVTAYRTPLIEDPARIGEVGALGLDETLFARTEERRTRCWCTSIVALDGPAQLLDVVEGRTAKAASDWLEASGDGWRAGIRWGVLDLSGPYRKTLTNTLPDATPVADPSHMIKVANTRLDECQRRVQNGTLMDLLEAGALKARWPMTWHAKETLRGFYEQPAAEAEGFLDELITEFADESHPPEVRSLGRTLKTWQDQILAWHEARVSNGPTESINNLIKRITRISGYRPSRSRCRKVCDRRTVTGETLITGWLGGWHASRTGSGSAASPTTRPESCSTPANPTGTYSPRSPALKSEEPLSQPDPTITRNIFAPGKEQGKGRKRAHWNQLERAALIVG
ncbi:MAG: transposase [Microthrixaceae bacterium]